MSTTKKNQFTMTPNEVVFDVSLGLGDRAIYLALRSYRNEKTQVPVYPSKATIAKRLGCSPDTVDRAIKRLEKSGHISHKKGCSGFANAYQFRDNKYEHTRTDAAIPDALERRPTRSHAEEIMAHKRLQPESYNHNYKPESGRCLFHGKDLASVMPNGEIRIKTHTGQWVDYGGGDEEIFCFGNLRGTAARQAAIAYFKDKPRLKRGNGDMVYPLPTNGEALEPNRPTSLIDNLNND
ncbi:MAG: helix-turn-helix domain-containing protein [Desulfobulbaceae bacterium]|nr:helix-turn-helix domain-containing protein [Desulfobulbaceae bacterium]